MSRSILRPPAVLACSGLSRSQLYAGIAKGLWVRPIRIGPRAAGFPSDEVDALISARVAGAWDGQPRTLVERLHQSRADLAAQLFAAT